MRKVLSALLGSVALTAVGMTGTASAAVTEAAPQEPVVFVHGYTGSASNWTNAEGVFEEVGYGADQLHAFEYDWAQSNKTSAEELSAFVDDVLNETGAQKVDIVNHSMGGLVSGWYAKKLGGLEKIDDWASIAGANHGTTSASACTVNASCREMLPNSAFVNELHADGEAPAPITWSTWYSPVDGVIIPYESTALEGANNTEVAGVTHLGFLSNNEVLTEVANTTAG